jgi:hypothetical protein
MATFLWGVADGGRSARGKAKNKDLNVWDQERCEEWFDGYSTLNFGKGLTF